MNLIEDTGTIHYGDDKLIVIVDPGIVDLARGLAPKYLKLNQQRYAPHISVVRHETPPLMQYWGKYEGQQVTFTYSPCAQNGQVYYWLDAYSEELKYIRKELGLYPSSRLTRPPDGKECFHITIGNCKQLIY